MNFTAVAVAVGYACGGIRRPHALYSGQTYIRYGGPMLSVLWRVQMKR